MRTVLGIDPGASGAIARIFDDGYITTCRMSETESDIVGFLEGSPMDEYYAFIERVHSMPKQGVASSFKFGASYGFLRGILIALRIPFEEVSPQKWQKEMGCLTRGDKNVSKARAQQLFPKEKIVHATADALLIAEYGRRVLATRSKYAIA